MPEINCTVETLTGIVSKNFTAQVIDGILKKVYKNLKDVKYEVKDISDSSAKGDSYLSTICRFVLAVDGTDANDGQKKSFELQVIAKSLPANIGRRKTFRSVDFFRNEVIFYEQVWPVMALFRDSKNVTDKFDNIPTMLSASIDGQNDYIAMKDVSYEGFGSAPRGSGLDYQHTTVILKLFAGFHGLALALKDQQPAEFEKAATSLEETYFSEKFRPWYENFQTGTLFKICRDAVEKELPPIYLEKLNKLLEGDLYARICKLCEVRGPLSVITHGDAWVPNFLFKYADTEKTVVEKVIMIDFQLTRYTTLSNDLLFFLFSCVDTSLLENQWDDLIAVYHKALGDTLEKYGSERSLVTLQDLKDDMKRSIDFGIGMSMEAATMSLLDVDDVADLDGIQGDKEVPLESVWIVHPFKEQAKRKIVASMIKLAVDKGLI